MYRDFYLFSLKVHIIKTVLDLSVKITNAIKIIYECLKNRDDFLGLDTQECQQKSRILSGSL